MATTNIANQSWDYSTSNGEFYINATSDTIGWSMSTLECVDYAKAWVTINASNYNSVTLNYNTKNHTTNSSITFGVFDNSYPDDDSGQTQLLNASSGSVTFDLSTVSGTKYVGFYIWGNSWIENGWGYYAAEGDMQITSIAAEYEEEIEEEIPEEVIEECYLEYNANGGNGAPSGSWVATYSTVTISSTVPTRFGYTFLGWSTSSSATSATYEPGDGLNVGSGLTLYAVWQSATVISSSVTNNSYSASIPVYNGYQFYSFTPSTSGTYRFESSGSLDTRIYLYNSSGTRLDYDDDDGDSNNFLLDYNFTSGTKYYINVHLYGTDEIVVEEEVEEEVVEEVVEEEIIEEVVQEIVTIDFTVKRLYTITYNANGGSGAPSSQTKIHDTTLTLSSTVPTMSGRTFLGWAISSSATSATYSAGGSFTTNADTTLYAVWNANEYTITYNANGGSGAPSSQTKTYDISLTLSSTVPTRFGYTFLGWSISSSATSATYEPGDSFTTNATTTLYAVWQSATTISSNSSYSTSISFSSGYKFYSFTPSTGGMYRFESSGSLDTQIYLYNSGGTPLVSNDDGAGYPNFRLDYNFIAGTKYYIKVKCYSSYTGTINFTVKPMGLVYIHDDSGEFCPYQIFIYDESGWNQYIPYIYNGSSWDLYS